MTELDSILKSRDIILLAMVNRVKAMVLEPQKVKSDTVSTVSPSISHEVMGPDAMILVF